MAYDVIIVGARVAGAATALLLARRGLRVLAVDRAAFPSDTLSSHQIQPPGVERLARWGLLPRISGAPPAHRVRFDSPGAVLEGDFPAGAAIHSPRRTVLDHALVEAARVAGAEVRERWRVAELVWEGGRVAGVRGSSHGGQLQAERARLVVGADGKRSFVAQAVRARAYRQRPPRSFACYTYWAGVPATTGELGLREGLAVAAFPTNGGLTMVYMSAPLQGFDAFRADAEGNYLAALDRCGDLGARVRAGTRAERLRTTPDLPNHFRRAYGPGWCLVGDAGVTMDPVSAQGIANALCDAERLAGAITAGLGGARSLRSAFAGHQRDRDRALRPMYDLTLRLATYHSGPAERLLLGALAERRRPAEIAELLGAFAGMTPVDEFFSARTALRLLGAQGLIRLATARLVGSAATRLCTAPAAR